MGTESTPRERLVASVALLSGGAVGSAASWEAAELYVSTLELFPQNTAQCPCCTKLVQLCKKHYLLHEPGKPCIECREGE